MSGAFDLSATTVQGQCDTFLAVLRTQGAGPRELALARLCFFAGAEGMTRINFEVAKMSEHEGALVLARVSNELQAFGLALAGGLGAMRAGGLHS